MENSWKTLSPLSVSPSLLFLLFLSPTDCSPQKDDVFILSSITDVPTVLDSSLHPLEVFVCSEETAIGCKVVMQCPNAGVCLSVCM